MNADIPTQRVWVDRFFLTNGRERGILEEGYAFGITSMKGRALLFHVMLKSGAHYRKIPLHALQSVPDKIEKPYSLTDVQLWDCFSYRPVVHVWDYLLEHQCDAILRTRARVQGTYRFSVDWLPDNGVQTGLILQPDQNKCAHVVELDNGQFAALPTNRVIWKDAYFIGNQPDPGKAGYVTDERVWQSETADRWDVSKDDNLFYGDKTPNQNPVCEQKKNQTHQRPARSRKSRICSS